MLIPEKNKKDLVEISRRVQRELDIIQVNHMDEVLKIAIAPKSVRKAPSRTTKKPPQKIHNQSNTKNVTNDTGRGVPSIQSGA